MKGRVLVLAAAGAALLVDGRLDDLWPDAPDHAPAPGDIHRASIDRILPNASGAFVRLGGEAKGFLRDSKGLKAGETVLVQVTGHPDADKALPATARVLYKGRRVIHTPGAAGINLSRQIREAEERDRLSAALAGVAAGAEDGFILRTAATGAPADEIAAEAAALVELARKCAQIQELGPIHRETPQARALRDWTDPLPDTILVEPGLALPSPLGSDLARRIQHTDSKDIFDDMGVRDAIRALRRPATDLPGGGWMAVEPTSAMVTVDVNTGGAFGAGAALTANLEAARALPRQLRLRGLGGQIIVDFAPLRKAERKRIEDALKAAFRRDPVETTLAGWTPLGNFELTRKRERRPLSELVAEN